MSIHVSTRSSLKKDAKGIEHPSSAEILLRRTGSAKQNVRKQNSFKTLLPAAGRVPREGTFSGESAEDSVKRTKEMPILKRFSRLQPKKENLKRSSLVYQSVPVV